MLWMRVIFINILPINKNGLRYGVEFWPLEPKRTHYPDPHVDRGRKECYYSQVYSVHVIYYFFF